MSPKRPLVIAFIYDSFSQYRSLGFSVEECMEFDTDDTIVSMVESLRACGHTVVPVAGIQQLVPILAEGKHKTWDLAFPTAEGMYGAGREAQVSALLEAYQIPHVFSDAATLSLSHDKGRTKMILEHMGIPTAPFVIVPAVRTDHDGQSISSEILNKTPHSDLLKRFPLFIKPNCEGSSKGIYSFSKAHNLAELEDGVRRLQTKYPDQSVIIESFLGGEEYTVSIIGSGKSARILGTVHLDWKSVRPADRCYNTADGGPDVGDDYPTRVVSSKDNPKAQQAEALALQAWQALECQDIGRVDIRWGLDGSPYVLEINAIPGLRPRWSTLPKTTEAQGISHQELIEAILESALERYPQLRCKN
ncbi:hypothetical protein Asppvi_003487 [Aspergillus pseudoviridinutans]|uniref:ATP-grasp domain-containing protein n=1 Tax=Aspergillus pseudoviridinutans TaxID=1517512 RepID=A0A9P3ET42_9EURO|nr:uncharacterized protein Asppvi_003487 [Aspergillus pseudoviridinutans]GIJ84638.1 hypothetical protein Asppvi_003487 [Aspergillus pseudoviridinutans]